MSQWPERLSALIEQGKVSVLVTIVEAKGSVPRGAGTKMIVTGEGIHHGTIGGGNLEYQCIGMAQQRLGVEASDQWSRKVHRFPLGASLGQCCGGVVIVLFEVIEAVQHDWLASLLSYKEAQIAAELSTPLNDFQQPKRVSALNHSVSHPDVADVSPDHDTDCLLEIIEATGFNIVVFGAGHVGRALVHVLSGVECDVTWVDSRANEFPVSIPENVTTVIDPHPEDAVASAPACSYFIVLTHSHSLDQLLCEKILARDDFRFCGLIGSKSKRMKFEHRLKAKGFSTEQVTKLTCPIGASGLKGKQPGHIAIAVAAQLLALQESYV